MMSSYIAAQIMAFLFGIESQHPSRHSVTAAERGTEMKDTCCNECKYCAENTHCVSYVVYESKHRIFAVHSDESRPTFWETYFSIKPKSRGDGGQINMSANSLQTF